MWTGLILGGVSPFSLGGCYEKNLPLDDRQEDCRHLQRHRRGFLDRPFSGKACLCLCLPCYWCSAPSGDIHRGMGYPAYWLSPREGISDKGSKIVSG